MQPDIVILNVGGTRFMTLRSTLLCICDTFFAALVRADPLATEYFVDRDPTHFRHVLNWLRGVHRLPEHSDILRELEHEADYYNIAGMVAFTRGARGLSMLHLMQGIETTLRHKNV